MTYDEIVNACVSYADRQDIEVNAAIGTFLIMAESRINRVLKTRKQSVRVTTPTFEVFEYYPIPSDYAGMRDIQINVPNSDGGTQSYPLDYASPIDMNSKGRLPQTKYCYSIIADQIQIYPEPATGCSLEIIYYQRVPPLTAENPENWMSIDHPDIYISGVTAEIEIFAKNYDVSTLWYKRMTLAINELAESDIVEKWSGSPLKINTITT